MNTQVATRQAAGSGEPFGVLRNPVRRACVGEGEGSC